MDRLRQLVSKALREATLTLEEAAARCGIPRDTVQAYRLGRRTAGAKQRARLAAFLRRQAARLMALAARLEAQQPDRQRDRRA